MEYLTNYLYLTIMIKFIHSIKSILNNIPSLSKDQSITNDLNQLWKFIDSNGIGFMFTSYLAIYSIQDSMDSIYYDFEPITILTESMTILYTIYHFTFNHSLCIHSTNKI